MTKDQKSGMVWLVIILGALLIWAGYQPDRSEEIRAKKAQAEALEKERGWQELVKQSNCDEQEGEVRELYLNLKEQGASVVCFND